MASEVGVVVAQEVAVGVVVVAGAVEASPP